ncbi:T9SS type A sorting domain-containing protein [Halocola ammonii]
MKLSNLLLTTILIAQFTTAQSQDYIPLPSENAIWQNQVQFIDGGYFYSYCTAGDTLINSQPYTKIDSCATGYKGAIRSENGKAFFVPADFSEEYLLYDFTLEEAETVDSVYTGHLAIDDAILMSFQAGIVDSILIGGEYRKRIQIESNYWIEGIGCTSGLFQDPSEQLDIVLYLSCFSVDSSILYPEESEGESCPTDFIQNLKEIESRNVKAYPNPTQGQFLMNLKNDFVGSVSVFDSFGQRLNVPHERQSGGLRLDLSQFPAGIYVVKITNQSSTLFSRVVKN